MNPPSAAVCPLCESRKVFTLRRFNVADLGREWLATFKFNPFVDVALTHPVLAHHQCGECELEFFSPPCPGDADFYARLSTGNAWYYEDTKWEFTEALRRLNANPHLHTLLEIGCGPGYFLEKVAGYYDASGIEINPTAVEACQRKQLRVTAAPLDTLPDQFDAIVAFEVLEHLPDPRAFLQQAVARLAPGGVLMLALPNPASYLTEFDHVLLDMPPHHATRWSKRTLQRAASLFGLQFVDASDEPLRYEHYQNYYWEQLGKSLVELAPHSGWQTLRRRIGQMAIRMIARAVMPLGYQYHKRILPGQTHLAELHKPR